MIKMGRCLPLLFALLLCPCLSHSQNFPGWSKKQPITINAAKVAGSGSHSNIPVLITLNHLDAEIVDGGVNSALNGGGDLRFSSDMDGNVQLAAEIVEFVTNASPSSRKCQVWVRIPSLPTGSNTTIYVWYGNPSASPLSATDPYGSQAVWINYDFVSHDIVSESSDGRTITLNDAAGLAVGPFGTDVSDFNGTSNYHTFDNLGMGLHTPRTVSCWVSFDDTNDEWQRIFQSSGLSGDGDAHGFQIIKRYDYLYFGADDNSGGIIDQTETIQTVSHPSVSWIRVTGDWVTLGNKGRMKVNDALESASSDTRLYSANNRTARFGNRNTNNNWFDGRIACFTISKVPLSDGYVTTEYNNQSNPSAFATAGIPIEATSGGNNGGNTAGYWTQNGPGIHYTSGTVGIGIAAREDYELAVNGDIITEKLQVMLQGTWPDYVFDADYDLPTLEEVRKHINEKGRLIHMPSAEEVEANGIELGEMNKLLLEKIEELTLYMIDQNRQQKILNKRIALLEKNQK